VDGSAPTGDRIYVKGYSVLAEAQPDADGKLFPG